MIGGVIFVVGLFLAMCAWMAFDDEPGQRWGRDTLKYAVVISGVFGVMFIAIWAWYGLHPIR